MRSGEEDTSRTLPSVSGKVKTIFQNCILILWFGADPVLPDRLLKYGEMVLGLSAARTTSRAW
jgi:hypothetical protein